MQTRSQMRLCGYGNPNIVFAGSNRPEADVGKRPLPAKSGHLRAAAPSESLPFISTRSPVIRYESNSKRYASERLYDNSLRLEVAGLSNNEPVFNSALPDENPGWKAAGLVHRKGRNTCINSHKTYAGKLSSLSNMIRKMGTHLAGSE